MTFPITIKRKITFHGNVTAEKVERFKHNLCKEFKNLRAKRFEIDGDNIEFEGVSSILAVRGNLLSTISFGIISFKQEGDLLCMHYSLNLFEGFIITFFMTLLFTAMLAAAEHMNILFGLLIWALLYGYGYISTIIRFELFLLDCFHID